MRKVRQDSTDELCGPVFVIFIAKAVSAKDEPSQSVYKTDSDFVRDI